MKTNRILSTAGLCRVDSTKLRSYCNLMQGSLIDKWLFADDFIDSHICFVRNDYLQNMDKSVLNKAQVIILVNLDHSYNPDFKYQISTPLTASKIRGVLNRISQSQQLKPLLLNETKPKKSVTKFKKAFAAIRRNVFRIKNPNTTKIEQTRKRDFLLGLSKSLNKDEVAPLKLVFLGSPGSGKTTAIQTVALGNALGSEVAATDSVASSKHKTTVGIDFAEIRLTGARLNQTRKLKLYGTPGQVKFNFVWDMIGSGADGFIILLDLSRPEPLSYLKFFQKFIISEMGKGSKIYCALTHCGKYSGYIGSLIEIIESEYSKVNCVYKIDARNKNDVSTMLVDIYPQIDSHLQKNSMKSNNIIQMADRRIVSGDQ